MEPGMKLQFYSFRGDSSFYRK